MSMSMTMSGDMIFLGVNTMSVGGTDTTVLSEVQVHATIVPLAGENQETNGSAQDEKQVEDAKEDEALGDANDIATIRDGEGDGVQKPEEVNIARQGVMVTTDVSTTSVSSAGPQRLEGKEEVGDGAEGVETPLVSSLSVGRAEVGNDPDPRKEDVEEDGRPAHATNKPKSYDDDGKGDDPEDVLCEKDLICSSVVDMKVLPDDVVGKTRGHCVVSDGTDEKGDGEEVVEDLLAIAWAETEEVVGEKADSEEASHSVKP